LPRAVQITNVINKDTWPNNASVLPLERMPKTPKVNETDVGCTTVYTWMAPGSRAFSASGPTVWNNL